MTLSWENPRLGTMARAGLWLAEAVGEGEVFTKEQLRQAFPSVTQIDRRVRELRKHGWVIHTSASDIMLDSSEQRLVKIGLPVWEKGARAKAGKAVTAKERAAAFRADSYQCVICGIAGGESYMDAPGVAVLGVVSCKTLLPNGATESRLVTQCTRCRDGSGAQVVDVRAVLAACVSLSREDLETLVGWMAKGDRQAVLVEGIWSAYRRMPADVRMHVLSELRNEL